MDARVTFGLMDRLNYPQIERELFLPDGLIHANTLIEENGRSEGAFREERRANSHSYRLSR